MSVARSVALNTAILFGGRIMGLLLALFSFGLLTRYLGVERFGQYTTIFAYITFFGTLADFGFNWIYTRELSLAADQAAKIRLTRTVLGLRLLTALFWALVALTISRFLPYTEVVRVGIVWALLNMVVAGLNASLISIFQANLNMSIPVAVDMISRLITLGGFVLMIRNGAGVVEFVIVTVVAVLFSLVLNAWQARGIVPLGLAFDLKESRRLVGELLPMGTVVVLGLIYFKVDTVMLSLMKPSLDVGLYGASYRLFEIVLVFPALFLGVVYPELSRALRDNPERARGIMQQAWDFLALLVGFQLAILFPLARPIVGLVAGKEFISQATVSLLGFSIDSGRALQLLLPAAMISYFGHLYGTVIIGRKDQKRLILPNLAAVLFNIIGNAIFIPAFSYAAAALTTVGTEILAYSFQARIAGPAVGFRPKLGRTSIVLLFALVVAAVLSFLGRGLGGVLPLTLLIAFGAVLYSSLLLLSRTVRLGEVRALLEKH